MQRKKRQGTKKFDFSPDVAPSAAAAFAAAAAAAAVGVVGAVARWAPCARRSLRRRPPAPPGR